MTTYPHKRKVRVTPNNNNKDNRVITYTTSINSLTRGKEKPLENADLAKSNHVADPYNPLPSLTNIHISQLARGDTNYQKAVMDAFRLLSSRYYTRKQVHTQFDQDLCRFLVTKYHLSCVDCKLECEMHQLEAFK
jgi:hypothetical protein